MRDWSAEWELHEWMRLDDFEIYWRMIYVGHELENSCVIFFRSFHFLPPTPFCLENRDKASALWKIQELHIRQSLGIWSLSPLVCSQELKPLVPLSPETIICLIGLAKKCIVMEIPEQIFFWAIQYLLQKMERATVEWGRGSENLSILQASFHQPSNCSYYSSCISQSSWDSCCFNLVMKNPCQLRIQLSQIP